MSLHHSADRKVVAALGPTNTGKTWLAVTRMMARRSGCIGLPLRLLAREVYERIVAEKGEKYAALVTGEEKIVPKTACWFACTVESMPPSLNGQPFGFVGVDEVQLADDPERGHVFTDRILKMRGSDETMLMGAGRMQNLLQGLGVSNCHDLRQRFSPLSHIGHIKLNRLPKRTAIVAFSADQVYALAEMLRRTRGGAAIVMGNLSPQTRNAQVALYQSGEVDYLIATDAIGLGLNMDIDHVALAETAKFDGRLRRELFAHELAQIVGRAGRGTRPGSFGTTGQARPLDDSTVAQIEENRFQAVSKLYWRNSRLGFGSVDELLAGLAQKPNQSILRRIRRRSDEEALLELAGHRTMGNPDAAQVRRLWEVCQLPDFRKNGIEPHLRLLGELADHVLDRDGVLPDDWFAARLQRLDRVQGNVDALSARLSHIRSWSYCANRADWLADPSHWRDQCRDLETRLSDALHEKLVQQFVDRRTAVLVRIARSNEPIEALFKPDGAVEIAGQLVGHLKGLVFRPQNRSKTLAGRTLRQASKKVLIPEIKKRMQELVEKKDNTYSLNDQGEIVCGEVAFAKLCAGVHVLQPALELLEGGIANADELSVEREKVLSRLNAWLQTELNERLRPLFLLRDKIEAKQLNSAVRGIGFQLLEALGAMDRRSIAKELREVTQEQRGDLRECGIRFGEFSLFMPLLLRPAPSRLLALILAFGPKGSKTPYIAPPGLTSFVSDAEIAPAALSAVGLRKCGKRLIRLDVLERIGGEIRNARQKGEKGSFQPTLEMVALLGCAKPDLPEILGSLGYRREKIEKDAEGEVDELACTWIQRSITAKPSQAKKPNPASRGPHKGTSKSGKKPARGPKPEKKIDPDSPFAVLQDLKLGKK